MNTILLVLKSRTFWTIVVMFAIGGFQSVSGVLPSGAITPILGALGLLATYFHINPSQNYNG